MFIASQTGPRAKAPSPMLPMTIPFLRLIFLNKAAPKAIEPEPPTMALFGMLPNGAKKVCIEPPRPREKPVRLA